MSAIIVIIEQILHRRYHIGPDCRHVISPQPYIYIQLLGHSSNENEFFHLAFQSKLVLKITVYGKEEFIRGHDSLKSLFPTPTCMLFTSTENFPIMVCS